MLMVHEVCKSYPAADAAAELSILRNVSLELPDAGSIAIMGPSGSGKSTLLNIIAALDTPTSGSVTLDNLNPFTLSQRDLARFRNRTIGFVFQEHHLLPHCSVLENVLLPTLAFPSRDATANQNHHTRAFALLDKVGLAERADHRPAQLSGGERQRAAIARALINRPRLVLADEPTGNLDQDATHRVAELLASLYREEGAMLILVTHNPNLAARFDRTLYLNRGTLCPTA